MDTPCQRASPPTGVTASALSDRRSGPLGSKLDLADVQRLNAGEAGGSRLSLRRSCLPLAGVQCPLCCLSSVLLAVPLPVRSLASMLCVDQCRTQCFLCPGLSEPVPSPACWLLQVVRVPFGMEPPWCPKWSKRVLASRDLGGCLCSTLPPWLFDVNTVTSSMHRHVCQCDLGIYSYKSCGRRGL